MLFSSLDFIFLFLPVAVGGYLGLRQRGFHAASLNWLILCSFFFYAAWDLRFVPLFIASILFNQSAVLLRQRCPQWGTHIITVAILCNLLVLGYFKYANFFLSSLGFFPLAQTLLLPLGISFYTFQQISYLLDCQSKPEGILGLRDYGLFVSFFPQLVAGPILHHHELVPQLADKTRPAYDRTAFTTGLFLFSIGLFKKVILADTLQLTNSPLVGTGTELGWLEAWVTSLSFTLQLYFDFGGYSDMALAIGLLCNLHLPKNFDNPYKAFNLSDFWKRWHMTLTRWFEHYLYYPLALRLLRHSSGALVLGFLHLAIFTLIGLWHGAAWGFVIFGLAHGVGISVHKYWQRLALSMPKGLAWVLTFFFINVTWVFFHSPTLAQAIHHCGALVGLRGIDLVGFLEKTQGQLLALPENPLMISSLPRELSLLIGLMTCVLSLGWILSPVGADGLERTQGRKVTWICSGLLAVSLFVLTLRGTQPFLYFNF
jgi:alginate O-acetyltransferase complex protein AlgI